MVAEGPEEPALAALDGATLPSADAVARLRAAGLAATRVLELDELFRLPLCREQNLFLEAETPCGAPAPILATPYGLTQPPLRPGRAIPAPGTDNELLTTSE